MDKAYHGGQFWTSVSLLGDKLNVGGPVINADVLDAWFHPCPLLTMALAQRMQWISQTSPPTHSEELIDSIAQSRNLPPECVLAGPGSSSLIYLAWREFCKPHSKVLIFEPTYGEYAHLTQSVCESTAIQYRLEADSGFNFDLTDWLRVVETHRPDIVVIVNPNNPTGTLFDVQAMVASIPTTTLVWVDEAYIDYTPAESSERIATLSDNIIVVKSLSKVFALSGQRVAYLVSNPRWVQRLAAWAPPWWVSLSGQISGSLVWYSLDYYRRQWEETHRLRTLFGTALMGRGMKVVGAEANWVLAQLPSGLSASRVCQSLAKRHIFVRQAGLSAPSLGDDYLRIAVKNEDQQRKILGALEAAFGVQQRGQSRQKVRLPEQEADSSIKG